MKQEEDARIAQKTNLHYRKFYEDELENDKSIFPDPTEPFRNIDIKRGQSRGLSKSWFSLFSADKEDDSGQVTNEKIVGKFKGRIRIYNREEKKLYEEVMQQKMDRIFQLLNDIHIKVFGGPMEATIDSLNS